MSDFEERMKNLTERVEEMEAEARSIPAPPGSRLGNPYGDDPRAKAEAIRRVLGGQVRYQLSRNEFGDDLILWSPDPGATGVYRGAIKVTISAFMHPDFTDLDIAREFGLERGGAGRGAPRNMGDVLDPNGVVSGNPNSDRMDTIYGAVDALAKTMNFSKQEAGRLISKMTRLAEANGSVAEAMETLHQAFRVEDEKDLTIRAENGIEAIVMDIQASILEGPEAVRERASMWLTKVTQAITAAAEEADPVG